MPDVAVVIGNYQGAHVLGDCLASLETQTLAPAEVIVVDAGSTDASEELARSWGAVFLRTENRGLGHLYNLGATHASSPYAFLLNNDVALDTRCTELLSTRSRRTRTGSPPILASCPGTAWDSSTRAP